MRITLLEKIGSGAHGQVFTATAAERKEELAVKIPGKDFVQEHRNELSMLQTIFAAAGVEFNAEACILQPVFSGKALISKGDAESESDCLVMPLCSFSLAQFIDTVDLNKLNETERLLLLDSVFSSLLDAITVLDRSRIHHADIKPENILWDDQAKKWKLIDFGTARFYKPFGPEVGDRGTMQFRAPEYCAHTESADGPWSDMYSMGKILELLLIGKERSKNDSNTAYYLDNAERYDAARADRKEKKSIPLPRIVEIFSELESLSFLDQFKLIAARSAATLEEDRPTLAELQEISQRIRRQLSGRLLVDCLLVDELLEAAATADSDQVATITIEPTQFFTADSDQVSTIKFEPTQFFDAPHYFNTDKYAIVTDQIDSHALSCASPGGVSLGAGSPARTPRFFERNGSHSVNSTPKEDPVLPQAQPPAVSAGRASPCLFVVPSGWDVNGQQLGFDLFNSGSERTTPRC